MGDPDRSFDIPLSRQISCVRREIAMRERVYPRLVGQDRMSQAAAEREQAEMQAVLETLEKLVHEQSPL